MEQHPPQQKRARWTAGSIALFVIGLLILVPSGLCTAVFGFTGGSNYLAMALMFSGFPMLLGAVLVLVGLASRRRD